MLKTGGKISIIVLIILLFGMTLLHQSREYDSYYTPWSNEGYINVNYFQHEVETDSLVSPTDYYYYSYGELGLLTISLIGIIIAIYLFVVRAKEGVFFTSDKFKLFGYSLVLLGSVASVFVLFMGNANTGVVVIPLLNKLLALLLSLIPLGLLIYLNFNKVKELAISFLLALVFVGLVIYLSSLEMYWFILTMEVMSSIVVVSLLLDDVAKTNATVYTVYREE